MSSIRLDALIGEFPEERDSLSRLAQFIDAKQEDATAEFSVPRLFAVAHPSSKRVLLSILQRLCDEGVLTRFVRVTSPGNGGIQDFASVLEVPDEIFDWRRGVTMEVSPEQIHQIYKLQG